MTYTDADGEIVASYTWHKGDVCIVASDGRTARAFYDDFNGTMPMEPVERAVLVARFRALAALIEAGPDGDMLAAMKHTQDMDFNEVAYEATHEKCPDCGTTRPRP